MLIPGTLNTRRYIGHVLEPLLLPYFEKVQDGIFQQDNARPHIAHVSVNFLADNNVNILP